MKQLKQTNRDQIKIASLEMLVQQNSMVRVIDCFLDFALNDQMDFKVNTTRTTGRPSFPVRTLLGIYIYGYLNKLRSSRALQRSCEINIELWWLLHEQKPCYKTICNFRKDNKKGFEKLFKQFRGFCKKLELYGKKTVAIDGTKIRAQNSKKNNFNVKKINNQIDYIENEQAYLNSLEKQDKIEDRLELLKKRKSNYQKLKEKLATSKETQISTTDPDARALPLHMNIVEVGYNIQSAVDDKHNLIVDYEVTNVKDNNALHPMSIKAKQALDISSEEPLTVLADKGYFKGEQLSKCHQDNIDTLVSPRFITDKKKPSHVRKDKFEYDKQSDQYICPSKKRLHKQARYKRQREGKVVGEFDRYVIRYSVCKTCPYINDCVTASQQKNSQGRHIDRSIYETAIDRNNEQIGKRKAEYKRRQAIVEPARLKHSGRHPFGTIKRQWAMHYTLLKTIPKVQTEYSIVFLCYNLKRVMSILGLEGIKEALKRAILAHLGIKCTTVPIFTKHQIQIHHAR